MIRRNFFKYLAGLLPITFLAQKSVAQEDEYIKNVPFWIGKNGRVEIEGGEKTIVDGKEMYSFPLMTQIYTSWGIMRFSNGVPYSLIFYRDGNQVVYNFTAKSGLRSIENYENNLLLSIDYIGSNAGKGELSS